MHFTKACKQTTAAFCCLMVTWFSSRASAQTQSVQRQHNAEAFKQIRFSPDLRLQNEALQLAPEKTSATFISPIVRNDFSCNAIGPHWLADLPEGTRLEMYLRTSIDGEDWGDWLLVPEDEDMSGQADVTEPSSQYASDRMGALVFVDPHTRFVQYKVVLVGNALLSPRLERVTLQMINSTAGPKPEETQETYAPPALSRAPAAVPKPFLYKRAEWGARAPARSYSYTIANHLVFHHTAGISDYNVSTWNDCAARVRAVQAYHMDSQGWDDIGYNYLICRHGSIFQGREDDNDATDVLGAHACAKNSGTMGVSMLGYFHKDNLKLQADLPTPEMLNSLERLLAWKCDQRQIDPLGRSLYVAHGAVVDNILGHRDVCSTACPGDSLYIYKPAIRDSVAEIISAYSTAVSEHDQTQPASFTLLPVYPNPFSSKGNTLLSTVHISFRLGTAQNLRVIIHNVMGQTVREWPAQRWAEGINQLTWDARNSTGQQVPAGVYFVQVIGQTELRQTKVLLVK